MGSKYETTTRRDQPIAYFRKYKSLHSTTLSSSISTGTGETITFASVTNVPTDTEITITIDRVDSSGTATASAMERITGTLSGSNLTSYTRGVDNSTEQAHSAGAVVEMVWNAKDWNDSITGILTEHGQDGTHDATKVAMLAGAQTITGAKTFSTAPLFTFGTEASGDIFYGDASGTITRLVAGTTGQVLTITGGLPAWEDAGASGASFWTTFSGAYASGTTLTVAGVDMTGIFKKGVVLKWLSSADAFKTGMVVSSSFSTDTIITIIGSTAASGDKTFYYGGDALVEKFIIPGTIAAGTDLAKTWYCPTPSYPLGCDAHHKTAGTTNATEYDINDDGTSLFNGTAASIATTATSDLNNAAYTPTTVIAADSLITVDVNSVSTTAPVEAYIDFYYFPQWWISRT